jgi:hypothetical protein
MALTEVLIDDSRFLNGKDGATSQKRIGMDRGVVTVETTEGGKTESRPATGREIAEYNRQAAAAVAAGLLQAVRDATALDELRDATVAYLQSKFPQDA